MSGRYEKRKPQKKGGKIALIILGVLVGLIVVGVIAGALFYNSMLNKMNRAQYVDKQPSDEDLAGLIAPVEETEETEAVTEPVIETTEEPTVEVTKPMVPEDIINVLVVGQSARPGEPAYMADSTMLVSINTYTKTITLSSVLRDAFVKFPTFTDPNGKTRSGGRVKFTSVYASGYAIGDVACAMEVANLTMLNNFGVEVDYNFEVDMEAFSALINAIDGVEMELKEEEVKYMNKELKGYCELEPGYNSLDGYMALTYARMRKAEGDGDSDIKRTARQRYLAERMIDKVIYKLCTDGFTAVKKLAFEILPYVTTNMENDEITKLLTEVVLNISDYKIEQGTCPVEGKKSRWGDMVDIYKDGFEHSVIRFDEDLNKKAMRFITEGEGEYPDTGK